MDLDQYVVNGVGLEHVRNRNEIRVIRALQRVLPEYGDFDGCRICLEDAYAAALSRLPHEYIQDGTFLAQSAVTDDEVELEVRKAIVRVMQHPRHN
jgi:hypothetical protein